VTLLLTVKSPMPAQLSVWANDKTLIQLTVLNPTATAYPNARASFVIRDGLTVLAKSKDTSPNIPRFTIQASGVTQLYGADIVSAGAVEFVNQQWQQQLANTNSLPDGQYEFCVTLYDANGNLITQTGEVCRPFIVSTPPPPMLVGPADKDSLYQNSYPTFTWTPVINAGVPQVQYKLTIVPFFGSQTGINAFTSNQPLMVKTLPITSYTYLPADPLFSTITGAKGFAWQVQAVDQQAHPAASNDGKSEIYTFTFRQPQQPIVQGGGGNQQNGPCNDNCSSPVPANTTPGGAFVIGDDLRIGKFTLHLTQVSGSGSGLSGAGTIKVPFLKAPILVGFAGIKVNSQKEVFDGTVEALQQQGSPISNTVANKAGQLGLSSPEITAIWSYASQAERLVSAFTGSTPVGLPVGFDNLIGGQRLTIAVMGMVFMPTNATLNAVTVFMMPDLGPNVGFGLGAREICFHPNGIGGGTGLLYLAADLGVDRPNSFGFVFKAPTLPADSGTYVAWDCNGFRELRIKAEATFPRDWLVPEPDNGVGTVKARLVASVKNAGDWIATAELDKCTIAGADGFGLEVQEMFYDHSDVRNPQGIVFPQGYAGTTGADWTGFFMKKAQVRLPKGLQTQGQGPPSFTVANLLIDGSGLTGSFIAANLVQYPKGDFGGWGASIDTVQAHFVSSSLQRGGINGRLGIPVCKDPLDYSALLSRPKGPQGKLTFQFSIVPRSNVEADLWFARLTIDKSSYVQIKDTLGSYLADARLDGFMSIGADVGNGKGKVPRVQFVGIKFEGFRLMSKAPYAVLGTWSLASEQHSMAGFPVSLDSVRPAIRFKGSDLGLGVAFTMKVNLHGESNGIAAATRLTIWGKMPIQQFPQRFGFDEVQLNEIDVHADLGAVKIDGNLTLYDGDGTYGDGFRGALSASFAKLLTAKATVQFGSVKDFRYWYIDAMVILSTGIPFGATGTALYGIGGGAWYHMARTEPKIDLHDSPNAGGNPLTAPADGGSKPGVTNSGVTFVPDNSVGLGFKAGVTIGTFPTPMLFSADVSFSMEFLGAGGVKSMAFNGDGYFISESMEKREGAMLRATVSISYDFPKQVFEGNFAVWTQGAIENVIKINAWMNLHIDPQNWHILIGTPSNRNSVEVLRFAKFTAYFMAGTDIPAPDFNDLPNKQAIELAMGMPLPKVRMPFVNGPVEGVAFGASLDIDTGNQCLLIICGRLALGCGFDIGLLRDPKLVCEETNRPPGIDGWYAVGQLYAYAYGAVFIDFGFGKLNVFEAGAGVRCVVMAPDPTSVQGTLAAHYSVLGGMIKGRFAFNFKLGDECTPLPENPIADIEWISDMRPYDGEDKVDVFAVPTASLILPVGQNLDLPVMDYKTGGTKVRTFRFGIESFTMKQVAGGAQVPGAISYSGDYYDTKFVSKGVLPGAAKLSATVVVFAEEFIGGVWQPAKLRNGTIVKQSRTVTFTSGPRPDVIVPERVLFSTPVNVQRFFLPGEQPEGMIGTKQDYLFQEPGQYYVRFLPMNGGKPVDVPLRYDGNASAVKFAVATLAPSTQYALQVIRFRGGYMAQSAAPLPKGSALPSSSGSKTMAAAPPLAKSSTTGPVQSSTSAVGPKTGSNVAAASVTLERRMLPGVEVRDNEFLLYHYYFQTSRYSTLAEKLNGMKFVRTDYSNDGGINEDLSAVFESDEAWDTFDAYGTWVMNTSYEYSPSRPLITVAAQAPQETWFRDYAWPNIYAVISQLRFQGLYPRPLANTMNLPFPFNTGQTVAFAGKALPAITPPSGGLSEIIGQPSATSKVMGTALGQAKFEVKLKYLHATLTPQDYSTLWTTAGKLAWGMSDGTVPYPSPDVYRAIQGLASKNLTQMIAAYQRIGPGEYALNFTYGPKLSWMQNGPWITRTFTYSRQGGGMFIQQPPAKPKSGTTIIKKP